MRWLRWLGWAGLAGGVALGLHGGWVLNLWRETARYDERHGGGFILMLGLVETYAAGVIALASGSLLARRPAVRVLLGLGATVSTLFLLSIFYG